MNRDQAIAIARRAAKECGPESVQDDACAMPGWLPPEWVIRAIGYAAEGVPINVGQHALVQLIEQCARTAVRACESVKYGGNEVQPKQDLTNRQRLTSEVVGLRSAALRCIQYGQLHEWTIGDLKLMAAKDDKVNRYLQYSVSLAMVLPSTVTREERNAEQTEQQG